MSHRCCQMETFTVSYAFSAFVVGASFEYFIGFIKISLNLIHIDMASASRSNIKRLTEAKAHRRGFAKDKKNKENTVSFEEEVTVCEAIENDFRHFGCQLRDEGHPESVKKSHRKHSSPRLS